MGGTGKAGDSCCGGIGKCILNATGPSAAAYGLDTCAPNKNLKCAPAVTPGESDAGEEDGGTAAIASCRVALPKTLGTFDLEGRCIPSCFITGDPSTANLGQSTCSKNSKCVPCYSPITAKSTGACNQGSDHPVEAAPKGFAECGDGKIGYCVASSAAMMSGGMSMSSGDGGGPALQQLTCKKGEVCAPKDIVINPHECFAHCMSPFGAGACVSTLVLDSMTSMLLQQADCQTGEVCAPCVSPLNQKRTGACDQR
jgi:hypothetical protein